jgi:glutamate synthase domain-containing protein 3
MTSGRVVVLGKTGRNFAAGMSGGIAYVLDEHQLFDTLCNLDMVDLEPLVEKSDIRFVRDRIWRHYQWTGSALAKRILDHWSDMLGKFVKVMPMDYRKALERLREQPESEEQPSLTDEMLAIEEVVRG